MERLQLIEKRARSLRTPLSVLYELLLFECVARPRPCTVTSTEIIIIIVVVITVARAPRANDGNRCFHFPMSDRHRSYTPNRRTHEDLRDDDRVPLARNGHPNTVTAVNEAK